MTPRASALCLAGAMAVMLAACAPSEQGETGGGTGAGAYTSGTQATLCGVMVGIGRADAEHANLYPTGGDKAGPLTVGDLVSVTATCSIEVTSIDPADGGQISVGLAERSDE